MGTFGTVVPQVSNNSIVYAIVVSDFVDIINSSTIWSNRQDEPGVAEVQRIHSRLVERLADLLEKYGQEQGQLEAALGEVIALRAACAKHGIKPGRCSDRVVYTNTFKHMNLSEYMIHNNYLFM